MLKRFSPKRLTCLLAKNADKKPWLKKLLLPLLDSFHLSQCSIPTVGLCQLILYKLWTEFFPHWFMTQEQNKQAINQRRKRRSLTYTAVFFSHNDWELTNSWIWLAEIDINILFVLFYSVCTYSWSWLRFFPIQTSCSVNKSYVWTEKTNLARNLLYL